MLGKACREKGELEGLQAPYLAFSIKPATPPNLLLYQTSKISTHRAQKGGTGPAVADSSIQNATSQHAESRF